MMNAAQNKAMFECVRALKGLHVMFVAELSPYVKKKDEMFATASEERTACADLEDVTGIIRRYSYWIQSLIVSEPDVSGSIHRAARGITKRLAELVSISTLVLSMPEEAERRARRLLMKRYPNSEIINAYGTARRI